MTTCTDITMQIEIKIHGYKSGDKEDLDANYNKRPFFVLKNDRHSDSLVHIFHEGKEIVFEKYNLIDAIERAAKGGF